MEISSMIGHTLPGYAIVLELGSNLEDEDTVVRFFTGMDEVEVSYLTHLLRLLGHDRDEVLDFLRDHEAPSTMWQEGVTRHGGESDSQFHLRRLGLHIDNYVAYSVQEIIFFEDRVADLNDYYRYKWQEYTY